MSVLNAAQPERKLPVAVAPTGGDDTMDLAGDWLENLVGVCSLFVFICLFIVVVVVVVELHVVGGCLFLLNSLGCMVRRMF